MKASILFARFPHQGTDHPDVTDWLVKTALAVKSDGRIDQVHHCKVDDTPITMSRNLVVRKAQALKVDLLCMIDNDMSPDIPTGEPHFPFWDSSFTFMLNHKEPCIVAAPYVGPPPYCPPYVFHWTNRTNDSPNPDMKLEMISREEAYRRRGFEEVAALPTGLILIDMRVFDILRPPYFYYEWKDETESEKASTEDVTFTRDASLAGVKIYCNWDAWAGHWKRYRGDKPRPLTVNEMRQKFVQAIHANVRSDEFFVDPSCNDMGRFAPQENEAMAPVGQAGPRPKEARPERRPGGRGEPSPG